VRIIVISDIHSNLTAFEAIIKSLPEFDLSICLGDIVGYGPQPNEVVQRVREFSPDVTLLGNHDHAVITGSTAGFSELASRAVEWTRQNITKENVSYLRTLKPSTRMKIENVEGAFFHGSPRDPLSEYVYPEISKDEVGQIMQEAEASLVLLGHTHIPMNYSIGGKMLANPGSVGQPRDGDPRASFAIITLTNGKFAFQVKKIEYDIASTANKIMEAKLPNVLADRLVRGR